MKLNKSFQSTGLCVLLVSLFVFTGASMGASIWGSIEIDKENLFSVEDAEYLKKLVPKESELLNNMAIANKQGQSFWYEFDVWVAPQEEKATAATLYKPDGTQIPLIWDKKDGDFNFETGEIDPQIMYYTADDLAADFPPGEYRLDVAFVSSGTLSWTITIPDYSTDSFPDLVPIALSEDASGQLVLDWQTVPDVYGYEVWAEKVKVFSGVYEEYLDAPSHPQSLTTALDIYQSKGDYQIGVTAKESVDYSDGLALEFTSNATVFSYKKPPVAIQNEIQKCTVKAGKTESSDSIQLKGLLDAIEADFLMAMGGDVEVTIDADEMPAALTWTFPIDEVSFKKGKYNYSRKENASQSSFKFDTKNGKMLFTAKKVDLTGLACPMTITVTIGAYSAQIELTEEIVNGSRKPCPPELMMGVSNTMLIDKAMVKLNKKSGADSLSVKGFFTIDGGYDTSNPLLTRLGDQTFTVPGSQFINKNFTENCSKGTCEEGPQFKAKLDFSRCTFQIQIKNAVITETGDVDFGIDCFGNDLPEQEVEIVPLSSPRYEIERYRCYNQFGRDWTYSASYTSTIDAHDDLGLDSSDSGTMTGYVSVGNSPVSIDGHACYNVTASAADSSISAAWYEDYYGTHQYTWGNFGGDLGFEAEVDTPLTIPKLLQTGQTFKDKASFTGDYELGIGSGLSISDFKGKMSIATTLEGFESVTVPYNGSTTYPDAAKINTTQTLDGSMVIYVQAYDTNVKAKYKATFQQTWWGVEDMGVVKSDTAMDMTLTLLGEKIVVSLTETDVLTGYHP